MKVNITLVFMTTITYYSSFLVYQLRKFLSPDGNLNLQSSHKVRRGGGGGEGKDGGEPWPPRDLRRPWVLYFWCCSDLLRRFSNSWGGCAQVIDANDSSYASNNQKVLSVNPRSRILPINSKIKIQSPSSRRLDGWHHIYSSRKRACSIHPLARGRLRVLRTGLSKNIK